MAAPRPYRFHFESTFEVPVRRLWGFYMEPGALERLTPPLSWFRVVDRGAGVANGSVLEATVGPWPFRRRWVAFHAAVHRHESFVDLALESPFECWIHLHRFEAVSDHRSRLKDVVWFLPPAGVPRWLGRAVVALALRWTFWWRHRVTRRALRQLPADARSRLDALCGGAAPGGSA